MSTDLRESDYQQAIDLENAKPDALQRDQNLIAWAQGNIDRLRNPEASKVRDAFLAHQNANGVGNEKDPLPQMTKYLAGCIARCRPKGYTGRH
ncbi:MULTISPECIES: hypothetical protein [Aeromonas]|uniref:Uncharacterized protein n=1 Tax=Aeromonas caviae TaxID=648 RepID=A0AAJ5Z3D7_AERCA|nr:MULTISPECIES: hypothetical protein [Aeromonas]MBP4031339.1 hypothetical protein [Aeromonas sp. PrichA-15]MCX4072433.1 hypothetical protein [Aeromonas caviae]WFF96372.1 hypothetical protein P5S46_11870 [Aeromonas caviae]